MSDNKQQSTEQRELMKKWNDKRAIAEKKGLEKFWQMYSSPILHPSKFKK